MNLALFTKMRQGWTIDLLRPENILKIFDGSETEYVHVFGPKLDRFGMHEMALLSSVNVPSKAFLRVASWAADAPPELTLVLATPQEGDAIPVQVLELLEMAGGATYTVPALVRGMEMLFFALVRHDEEEFKLLGLIGPKTMR